MRMSCSWSWVKGYVVCLFLQLSIAQSPNSDYTPTHEEVHRNLLLLKSKSNDELTKTGLGKYPNNLFTVYLQNVEEVFYLFLKDEESLYNVFKKNEAERLKALERISRSNPYSLFFQAEIKIHWAVLKMKFGDELGAAWSMRQAYFILENLSKTNPDFQLTYKSLGLLHVLIGTIPTKYSWIVSILGMKGGVELGLKEMYNMCNQAPSVFQEEACLTLNLVEAFVLKKTELAVTKIENTLLKNPESDMLKLILGAMYLNIRQSNKCLSFLKEKPNSFNVLTKPYMLRMLGDAYLYKGDYQNARECYLSFLKGYNGRNYIKDAYFKMYLTYWLQGEAEQGEAFLKKIMTEGQAVMDTDKRALAFAKKKNSYHPELMRYRLMYDGGYYDSAISLMQKKSISDFQNPIFRNEYHYRLARLYHAVGKTELAKEHYLKCVETNPIKEELYFAPNSAYSLGLIFKDERDIEKAKFYFQKAISYRNHEYKNSIDNKSKAQLEGLK